jgi:glyoxylase-like metal-dependent hydrolase (beta-lactamase superfamily II)
MRLTKDICLVGGGNSGFGLSAPLDCHIYVIDGGTEAAIVDAGMGGKYGATDQILANIQDAGVDTGKISSLLLTHYHADHAGGAADFRNRLGLDVFGSPLTVATFPVGDLTVTVYDTPGHSDGHVSLLVSEGDRTYLIGGDLVFFGGTIIAQNIHDCSIQNYSASTLKMAEVDFDAFLPGHLSISLTNGKRHIDQAAAQFKQLMIPRNAV